MKKIFLLLGCTKFVVRKKRERCDGYAPMVLALHPRFFNFKFREELI